MPTTGYADFRRRVRQAQSSTPTRNKPGKPTANKVSSTMPVYSGPTATGSGTYLTDRILAQGRSGGGILPSGQSFGPGASLASLTGGSGGSPFGTNPSNIIGGGSPTSFTGAGSPGTGWMSGIAPDAATMLFENPDAFLRQVLSRMGHDPDAMIGAMQLASPVARNMNELAMIMLGANPDFEAGELNQVGNWMANMLANQLTPGGRFIDFGQGLSNLLGVATGGADQLSALGSILGIDDPAGQTRAFQALATALASASLHPLWARGFQDELSRQGDAYISKNATNLGMDPYNQWLRSRGFSA